MRGYIFNIQKFSIHDGPGIRSTVFFKGCSLRCKWCANPESQCMLPQMTLDKEKCRGCMACVEVCPSHARSNDATYPTVNLDSCTGCGACIAKCPAQAIGREGDSLSVAAVVEEVLKDKPFYDHSGGGVTFSGGEVLCQQEFATELARALHERGVHVAVETAAAVPNPHFCEFMKEIDYAFVDLKHYDSQKHLEGTGEGNEAVIENIRSLVGSGMEYTVRIPVIPAYNDALDDACGFAELLRQIGVPRVQLLPFHQLGERKYALLGMDYALAGKTQLHSEDLQDYRAVFEEYGIVAFV